MQGVNLLLCSYLPLETSNQSALPVNRKGAQERFEVVNHCLVFLGLLRGKETSNKEDFLIMLNLKEIRKTKF